ncbi:MAG: hypothetical protein ACLRT4_09060 [Thomasclavelia sp.]
MTIPEYQIRVKAANLKLIDMQENIYSLAWAIRQSQARKKSGRMYFKTFRQFFDRKKIEKRVFENKKDESSLMQIYKRMRNGE